MHKFWIPVLLANTYFPQSFIVLYIQVLIYKSPNFCVLQCIQNTFTKAKKKNTLKQNVDDKLGHNKSTG